MVNRITIELGEHAANEALGSLLRVIETVPNDGDREMALAVAMAKIFYSLNKAANYMVPEFRECVADMQSTFKRHGL